MNRSRGFRPVILVFCLLLATTLNGQEESGIASFYGDEFDGRKTASGEIYDPRLLTAAHPTLRFGIRLEVTNLDNGLTVQVRVNDRGPFVKGRVIDLSRAAAEALGMVSAGTANVVLRALRNGVELPPPLQVFFQMGAYRTEMNAMAQVRSLTSQGFEPRVRLEGTLYRVFLAAPEGTPADLLLERLKKAGLKGFVQSRKEPAGTDVNLPSF